MTYENLLDKVQQNKINYFETDMPNVKLKGLYSDNMIFVRKDLDVVNKRCVLAEELGHYYTSTGDILDYSSVTSAKQERVARIWAAKQLIKPQDIIRASQEGVRNRYELAEFLGVTELFLQESIEFYKSKYGLSYKYKDYTIIFEPLGVIKNVQEIDPEV